MLRLYGVTTGNLVFKFVSVLNHLLSVLVELKVILYPGKLVYIYICERFKSFVKRASNS